MPKHSVRVTLSEREHRAIEAHCQRYGIVHRAKWVRELIMIEVIRRSELDSPLLFDEDEMR